MTVREKSLAWQTEQRRYNFVRIWQKRYAHMLARHDGRATHYSHCEGKGIMTKPEFFEWCKQEANLDSFMTLWFTWAMNGFNRWDSPSIDRIDPDGGYVDGNLQWLSFAENTEKNHKDPITHKELRHADSLPN